MQLFFDFLPVLAFFIAYKIAGIYVATAILMAAMLLLCAVTWLRTRKISGMMLTGTVIALAAGTLTLLLHDAAFIKWKLTLIEGVFALAFLIAPYVSDKTLVERIMGEAIKLQPAHWRTLNWMWIIFFAAIALLNVYVLRNFSEAAWVNFKLFGTMGLTLVFVVLQAIWLANKMPKDLESGTAASSTEQSDRAAQSSD